MVVRFRPYHAFSVLASIIEILGKCLNSDAWNQSGCSEYDFGIALSSFPSLQKYYYATEDKTIKIRKKGNPTTLNKTSLYHSLRCSIIHAGFPDGVPLNRSLNIVNTTTNGIEAIGCDDLYNDILKAWDDLKSNNKVMCLKNLDDPSLIVYGTITADTSYSVTSKSSMFDNLKGKLCHLFACHRVN